jgi:hypothetical protein
MFHQHYPERRPLDVRAEAGHSLQQRSALFEAGHEKAPLDQLNPGATSNGVARSSVSIAF